MNRSCIVKASTCHNLLLSCMQWHGIFNCETWATGHPGHTTMLIWDASKTSDSGETFPDAVVLLFCQIARKTGKAHSKPALKQNHCSHTSHRCFGCQWALKDARKDNFVSFVLHSCLHYLHLLLTALQDILGATFLLLLLKHLLCPFSPDLQNHH